MPIFCTPLRVGGKPDLPLSRTWYSPSPNLLPIFDCSYISCFTTENQFYVASNFWGTIHLNMESSIGHIFALNYASAMLVLVEKKKEEDSDAYIHASTPY